MLATSVERRRFDVEGDAVPTHGDYPASMRAFTREEGVALLDLQALSLALWQKLGVEETKKYFNWTSSEQDNTHFNPPGAIAVAGLVVGELLHRRVLAHRDARRLDDEIPERPGSLGRRRRPSAVRQVHCGRFVAAGPL